ncbi:multidrug resistance protein homolog 49-like [Microplitis demolitor]|uniref:multidrug resistance protein homolog 49-like n=1 Tax=Microplitis demolitor TaxID=69319 RepID=UPI0004CCDFE7|nr:multidrug resistance protein homolog 49-like [Microplitis demolitor]
MENSKTNVNNLDYSDTIQCTLPQFSFASCRDISQIIIGLISAILTGICTPGIIVLYANLAEVFLQYEIALSMSSYNDTTRIPVGLRKISEEEITPRELASRALKFSTSSAVLGLAQLIFTSTFVGCFNNASLSQVCRAKNIQFKSILQQNISWISQQDPEELAANSIKNIRYLQTGLDEKVGNFIATLSTIASCIMVSIYYGYQLTGTLLAVVPVIAAIIIVTRRVIDYVKKQEANHYRMAQAMVKQTLNHMRCVCAYSKEEYEVNKYIRHLVPVEQCDILKGTIFSVTGATLWIIIYGMYGFAFWQGVHLLRIDKSYSVASLIIVSFCTHIAVFYIFQIPLYVHLMRKASTAARRILMMSGSTLKIEGAEPSDVGSRIIVFNNVTFRYSLTGQAILRNVSFDIDRGTTVGILGSQCSGKTTLLSLIHRFHFLQRGKISFNGMNIEDIDLSWLRKQIGFAQQCPVLFGTTMMESITCLTTCKSDERVHHVAEIVGMHSLITELPQGYNTPLTWDLQVDLRQRLALARILYREPEVLMMDDSLSALSSIDEEKIFNDIKQAYDELTIIIVTNNPRILDKVDKILYLNDGNIDEFNSIADMIQAYPEIDNLIVEKDGKVDNFEVETMAKGRDQQPSCNAVFPRTSSFFGRSYQQLLRSGLVQIGRSQAFLQAPNVATYSIESRTVAFKKLIKFLLQDKQRWLHLLFASLASIILGLNAPMYTVLYGETLSLVALFDTSELLKRYKFFTTMFFAAGFVASFCKIVQDSMLSFVDSKLMTRIRRETFRKFLQKNMEWFDTEARTICEILGVLRKPPEAQQGCARRLVFLIETLASVTVSVILSMFYHWKLGLASLIFTPMTLSILQFNKQLITERCHHIAASLNKAKKTIIEATRNAEAIAALNLENKFIDFDEDVDNLITSNQNNVKLQAFVHGCCVALPQFAYSVAVFYGGYMLSHEEIDSATVFKVAEAIILGTLLVGHLVLPMESTSQEIDISANFVNILDDVTQFKTDQVNRLSELQGKIIFKQVSFVHSYYAAIPKLYEVNINIKPGELVAFVGRLHSGVSIPIQLLLGFYKATSGDIFFDDQQLNDSNLKELRRQMGLVEGEPRFFNESIAYNISYGGNRKMLASEIIATARHVGLHEFISSLPKGYYTVLDESEVQLTTSQRIKLSLARALVRNPRILLFDNLKRCESEDAQQVIN